MPAQQFPVQTSIATNGPASNTEAVVTISGVAGKRTTLLAAIGSTDGTVAAGGDKGTWIAQASTDVFFVLLPPQGPVNLWNGELVNAINQTISVHTQASGVGISSQASAAWRQD